MRLSSSKLFGLVAALAAAMFLGPVAMATTPTMPPVVFPVDVASIVTSIGGAGVTVLLAVFGIVIAFALVKKLFRRVKSAI